MASSHLVGMPSAACITAHVRVSAPPGASQSGFTFSAQLILCCMLAAVLCSCNESCILKLFASNACIHPEVHGDVEHPEVMPRCALDSTTDEQAWDQGMSMTALKEHWRTRVAVMPATAPAVRRAGMLRLPSLSRSPRFAASYVHSWIAL